MIVGSGLVASAFSDLYADNPDVCIYAAGVSNSACTDSHEFEREKFRLQAALTTYGDVKHFVYFGTCSVYEAQGGRSAYVIHKILMEQLVESHPNGVVFRLPQLAGRSVNPHTLLNYLYSRISRSEKFDLWIGAIRNIIDVQDVVHIVVEALDDARISPRKLNIANPRSYPITDIVSELEAIVGKPAHYYETGYADNYTIDVSDIKKYIMSARILFDEFYLRRVLRKYFT